MNDDLLNDFFLESFPNPERKGCPDEQSLRAFAEDRLPAGNPILQHISSCSECYAEYRHYRQDWKEASNKTEIDSQPPQSSELNSAVASKLPVKAVTVPRGKALPWAIAACILVLLAGGFFAKEHHTSAPTGTHIASSAGPVNASVDLFDAVTVRGGSGDEPTPLQEQVSLPSSIVNLAVTLPRFSQSGPYEILVSKDRAGKEGAVHGTGSAVEANGKVSLTVTLDLRNTAPGMYFLATVRGSDNGTYYYPLKVN